MEEQKLLKKKQKALGNNAALISACTDLVEHYSALGRYSKVITECKVVANIFQKENKPILYAQAHRTIGEAYMGLQDFQKALEHFKIYLDISVRENNILEQQRALAQLGHMYLTWYLETLSDDNKKLLDEAYAYFMRSMKKCDSLPDNVERQDMLARLFSNLGLVKESLGDYNTSLNLYEKSIKICLKHDLYEQLFRGYISMASLFEKQARYQETIDKYNLAIEVAKKLGSKKAELISVALLAKSGTLIKIADFHGAKQVLRKAYKFKTPNNDERTSIERNLRVVAAMCKTEDEIITCNDESQLKNLYEKMGDGACDLKNFAKAVEYYKKMLEAAEKQGASDKELGECYYSLGKTYEDNGQYAEAETYFEKEYNLCQNNLKDSLNTLCKIADLKQLANCSGNEIKRVYERAMENCRKKGSVTEEMRIVKRYINFLRKSSCHSDVYELEKYLKELNEKPNKVDESSSSDSESEDFDTKVHIGHDIVLSDVTDLSEASDNEPDPGGPQSSKRRKHSNVKFKKNLNGEWPLHVACIKGNFKMVQYWIDVDHPINVRDHAGWLPIHEAAVHGHVDIVNLLLDHKASINDRGGSKCNGITPLHDAASNGHLEVIQLLLDRGASAVAKTDDGNTPLFELKRWHERNCPNLDGDRKWLYDRLIERLTGALDKAGQTEGVEGTGGGVYDGDSFLEEESECGGPREVGRLRRNTRLEEDDLEYDEAGIYIHNNTFWTPCMCNGITPLHDAASNGHLEVIQLLLDRGASAVAKTDDGNTPLFELKRWHERNCPNLDGDRKWLYDRLIERLTGALDKAGQTEGVEGTGGGVYDGDSFLEEESECGGPREVGRLRRNTRLEEDDLEYDEAESPEIHENVSRLSERSLSNEYQQVMQNLRHKNYTKNETNISPTKSNVKRGGHVNAEEFVDDWLEEDVRPTKSKKRKLEDAGRSWGKNRSFGSSSKSPRSSSSRDEGCFPVQPDNEIINFLNEDTCSNMLENNDIEPRRRSNESFDCGSTGISKKKTQVTLLDSGFSRHRNSNSPGYKLSLKRNTSFESPSSTQPKITSLGQTRTTVEPCDSTTFAVTQNAGPNKEFPQTQSDPTLFVDVEIVGRLFRVPVLLSQIQNRSIRWLAEEAAQRYASKECMKPTLELETSNGAILADDDLLSLLFPMGGFQAEKVVAKVLEWSLPPVIERYRDTCMHMSVDIDQELSESLESLSVNLDLSNRGILSDRLSPLLKAINHQSTLTDLNLSGNFLSTNCVIVLCTSLATLLNLEDLNLSCTGLQATHLSLLANTFSNSSTVLSKLTRLDLSDNVALMKTCLKDVARIANNINLATLSLSNVGLKERSVISQSELRMNLVSLETLDLSNNELSAQDVRKFLTWTDAGRLATLDLSNNRCQGVSRLLVEVLEGYRDGVVLESVKLARCGVNDSDLFELLGLAPRLSSIDLAYNPDLTSISLRRLLEHGGFRKLNLTGCENVWKYFDANDYWRVDFGADKETRSFKISGGCDAFFECIVKMFGIRYSEYKVEKCYDFLCITLGNNDY